MVDCVSMHGECDISFCDVIQGGYISCKVDDVVGGVFVPVSLSEL